MKHILKTISIIVVFTLLLTAIFYTFNRYYHLSLWLKPFEALLFTFIFVFAIYRCKYKWLSAIICLYLAIGISGQFIHLAIYGEWLTPIEIWLFFEKFSEVAHIGEGISGLIITPVIFSIVFIVSLVVLFRLRQANKTPWLDIIIILALIFLPIRIFVSHTKLGLASATSHCVIKANYYTLSYFIGATLPEELLGLKLVGDYSAPTPQIVHEAKINNIIMIMGESNSASHNAVFHYHLDTSPFLTEMKSNHASVVKETYSAGVLTDISLPSLFNMVKRPNGSKLVASGNNNLFRMATQQGFETYFYSAQGRKSMSLIMPEMGVPWINHHIDAVDLGYSIYDNADDFDLMPAFKKINLQQGKHFIVLHQIGSHSPYQLRTPKDKAVFGLDTMIEQYDSSIHYTDQFIHQVYNYLMQQPNKDWILIYTSDHGQSVDAQHFSQGLLTNEGQYIVPSLIYSPNDRVQKAYLDMQSCPKLFHYQISTLLANLFGYNTELSDCNEGYVNGQRLSGNAGYIHIQRKDDTYQHTMILPH